MVVAICVGRAGLALFVGCSGVGDGGVVAAGDVDVDGVAGVDVGVVVKSQRRK